jgi:hypothetical protein
LFEVKLRASEWFVLGDGEIADEATQTGDVAFEMHCNILLSVDDFLELLLIDEHAFLEDETNLTDCLLDHVLPFVEGCICVVKFSDHFDVYALQTLALSAKPLGEDVLDEPLEVLVSTLRNTLGLLVDTHFDCTVLSLHLLDHVLLEVLNLLFEVAFACVVANDSDLVFNVLVVYLDQAVFQQII